MSKIRGVFIASPGRRIRIPRENKPRRGPCPPLRLDKTNHGCARFGPLRARFGQILPESRPYAPTLMRRPPSANPSEGDASPSGPAVCPTASAQRKFYRVAKERIYSTSILPQPDFSITRPAWDGGTTAASRERQRPEAGRKMMGRKMGRNDPCPAELKIARL
jgi:hypothetical protein